MVAAETQDANPFQTQAGRVYDKLCEMIASGEIGLGEPVPLEPMAKRLGLSVTPVRDAMRQLAHHGILEGRPRFGYQVVCLTQERVRGYFVLREALFAQAGRLACWTITDEQLRELSVLGEELDGFITRDDKGRSRVMERAFHGGLARIAGCRELEKEIQRISVFRMVLPVVHRHNWHTHGALLEALAGRDELHVDEEMRRHVRSGMKDVLPAIETHGNRVREMVAERR